MKRTEISKISQRFLTYLAAILLVFTLNFCSNGGSSEHPAKSQNFPADSAITNTVKTQLQDARMIDASNIKVQTHEDIVTLSGPVDNLLTKDRANDIAESVTGVLSVINHLTVAQTRPDNQVAEDVRRAVNTDPATETWEISAAVQDGVVQLKGVVDSWQEKHLAGTLAKSVKGVTGLKNNLIINYNGTRTDNQIQAEVKSILKWDSRLDDKLIKVSVENGVVRLSGSVGSAHDKTLAKELAHTNGVKEVMARKLKIHPELRSDMVRTAMPGNVSKDEIKTAMHRAFSNDPRVPDKSISVEINNKTATLTGSVKNLDEKLSAGQDALNTIDIEKVKNDIDVQNVVVVKAHVPTTDKAIAKRIREKIIRDPYTEIDEVNVKVNSGIASISGTVDSKFEKQHIENILSDVKGVIAINDNLKIQSDTNIQ